MVAMWGEIQTAGASSWNNQPPGLVSQLHKHSFQQLLNGPIKNNPPPKKTQKIQCSGVKTQEEGLEETESSKAKSSRQRRGGATVTG